MRHRIAALIAAATSFIIAAAVHTERWTIRRPAAAIRRLAARTYTRTLA